MKIVGPDLLTKRVLVKRKVGISIMEILMRLQVIRENRSSNIRLQAGKKQVGEALQLIWDVSYVVV